MSDDIRISVALVTRNRPDSLRRCLASLRAQEAQPFEVVVSDDSEETFVPAVRDVAARFDGRYLTGPRRGLYANRNFAARQCAGTHVRTMDDDHTFPAGHFTQCIAAVRNDPRAIWTTGEIGYIEGTFHAKAGTAAQLHPSGVGGPIADLQDNWAIADGSTIYPRGIFEEGLFMIEDLGFGSAYLEYGAFLYDHGWRSRCVEGAAVEHYATRETLAPVDVRNRLFASICFNLYFRRNLALLARYCSAYALLREPALISSLPSLLEKARRRWRR